MIAAALILIAALIVLGVGVYLMLAAHDVRRESDRTIQRLLAEHGRERRDLMNRLMFLADKTYEAPPSQETELKIPDLWGDGVDVNVDSAAELDEDTHSLDGDFRVASSGAM